jgi:hypothetical protein
MRTQRLTVEADLCVPAQDTRSLKPIGYTWSYSACRIGPNEGQIPGMSLCQANIIRLELHTEIWFKWPVMESRRALSAASLSGT